MTAAEDDLQTSALLDRLATGDRGALDELLTLYRTPMRTFVDRRLETRLRTRVDPSDVIQEASVEIARRIDDFLERRPMPFRLWVLKTSHEHILRQRRKHIEADCRDIGREQGLPDHSTQLLAGFLLNKSGNPCDAAQKSELHSKVRGALATLPETDREILLLRIFEGLDNHEVARVLDLEPDTASKRFGRALIRLRKSVGPLE
jgi:RNA polymerase sigma-70 factor, ECF subfamily